MDFNVLLHFPAGTSVEVFERQEDFWPPLVARKPLSKCKVSKAGDVSITDPGRYWIVGPGANIAVTVH